MSYKLFTAIRKEMNSTLDIIEMRQRAYGESEHGLLAEMALKAVTFDRIVYLIQHGYDDPNWPIVQGIL